MLHFRCRFHISFLLYLALGLALLSGCGTKDVPTPNQDELVTPYTPRDDGKPLTPTELKAFRTQGELDKNLKHADKQIVELHFKYFVHENRKTFERFLARSARYLPHAKKTFKQRGLPEDLAYLFMIESGGNPNAVSPAKATGLWQFMPFTGKKYGLEQNQWIDERRDPYKATFAASDYLLKLYGDFKNWHLAAAAYNAGEGKIGRALSGTGSTDFFELCRTDCNLEEAARLRDETRQYVPRLIAVAKIMRNLKLLGFSEPTPDMAEDLHPIMVPAGTDLKALAQTVNMSWPEFAAINPAYRRSISPPSASSTAYLPPVHHATVQTWLASGKGKASLAEVKKQNKPEKGSKSTGGKPASGFYLVEKGDTLYGIARTHNMSVGDLCTLNDLQPKSSLRAGQRLRVGKSTAVASAAKQTQTAPPAQKTAVTAQAGKEKAPQAQQKTTTASKGKNASAIVVKSGDTLFSLAKKHNVSVDALRKSNRLTAQASIKPGQKLVLPR